MAGILIANNIVRLTKSIEAATETWKALETRGLALGSEPTKGLAVASGPERPVLAGQVSGVAVEVHIRSDFVHFGTTEVSAVPGDGMDAEVGVHPSPGGVLGYLRSLLGQDVEVGDEAFDEAFLITSKPESAAKVLLTPPLQHLVVAIEPAKLAALRYTKERVLVVLNGVETDAAVLGAAVDLCCAAANRTL